MKTGFLEWLADIITIKNNSTIILDNIVMNIK